MSAPVQCPKCNGSGEMHHVEDGVTVAQQCSGCDGVGSLGSECAKAKVWIVLTRMHGAVQSDVHAVCISKAKAHAIADALDKEAPFSLLLVKECELQ